MLVLRRTVIQILRDLAKGSPHFYAGLFGLSAKYLVQGNGPPCGKVDDPLDDFFDQISKPYGAERYLENRRVKWSFLDGICKDGYWSEKAGEICFVYEDKNSPPNVGI